MHPLVRGFRCRRTSSVFVRLSSKTIFWKQSVVWYSVYLCNKMKLFFNIYNLEITISGVAVSELLD